MLPEQGSFDLHIGLSAEQAARMRDEFTSGMQDPDLDGPPPEMYQGAEIGGTSWEQWGEEPFEGADEYPPDYAEHVVIRHSTVSSALLTLGMLRVDGFDLLPMRFPRQEGIIAAITESEDWAECFISILAGRRYPDLMPTPIGDQS